MNQYPRDEFDAVPERSQREGAHRSFLRVRDPRRGVWAIVVVGVLVLILGLVMYLVVRPVAVRATGGDEEPAATSAPATTQAPASPTTAAPTTEQTAPTTAPTTPSTAPTTTAGTTSPAETTATSPTDTTPDLGTAVGVYNGTKISGLASGDAGKLRAGGFTRVSTGNWTKSAATSAVYFKSPESEATAEKVASRLGISTVIQTSNIPTEISVVIGADRG